MSEATPLPRITMNTEFVDPKPVINEWAGEVMVDRYKTKLETMGGGWQWEIAVRPLNGFVKGKTGSLFDWADVKLETDDAGNQHPKKGTKLELIFNAFKEVFGASDTPIGDSHFVGKYAMFARYEKNWGFNNKTKQDMKGMVLVPLRPLTDDEMREYGLLGANDSTTFEYTDELIEEALAALDGVTKQGIKIAVINAGFEDKTLAQRLLSGEGVEYLIGKGLLSFDGKNYHRVKVAVAA